MSSKDHDSIPDPRREHARQLVCIPAFAQKAAAGEQVALVSDISMSGAYFLTQAAFEPGDRIRFTLHLTGDPDGPRHEITADVVRVEEREPEEAGIWGYGVAVQFDIELTDVETEIEELAALLAERYPDRERSP